MLRTLKSDPGPHKDIFLIESPLLYESIRPFLKSLCREPSSIPFSRYLTYPENGTLRDTEIYPPCYATAPGFKFDLNCLMKTENDLIPCELDVTDPASTALARNTLKEFSRLDPSQCDAVVDALSHEVALIQG